MATAVMPTCTVEMTDTGSSISLSAAAARLLPARGGGGGAARRDVITEYSAITKNALRATSPRTARTRSRSLTHGRVGVRAWIPLIRVVVDHVQEDPRAC